MSFTHTLPLQAAGASGKHPSEEAAGVNALDHALTAQMHTQHIVTPQGTEEADYYFSRFSEGQTARATSMQNDKPGEYTSNHDGVQEQSRVLHKPFVLAKPVRLL